MKDARLWFARGAWAGRTASRLQKQVAVGLVMLLTVSLGVAETTPLPSAPLPQTTSGSSQDGQTPASDPATQTPANPAAAASGQSGGAQAAPQSTQTNPPPPQGTAAAPVERTVGVAASRPAGAAIAPAKQKRARSFLIRIGIVVGAAAAVGTVVALSNASPSRPH